MPAETVRVTPDTHRRLKELAEMTGEPMTVILKRAVEAYRRDRFLDECDRAYARLKGDAQEWAEELAERKVWEGALADGLENS